MLTITIWDYRVRSAENYVMECRTSCTSIKTAKRYCIRIVIPLVFNANILIMLIAKWFYDIVKRHFQDYWTSLSLLFYKAFGMQASQLSQQIILRQPAYY